MTKRFSLSAAAAIGVSLIAVTGCASVNVDPCSRAGIQNRLAPELAQFARENRSDINEIKKAAAFIGGETRTGGMQIAFAARSLRNIADNFETDIVPELVDISLQCDADKHMKEVFIDYLRDEGVSGKVLDWVDDFTFDFES